MKPMTVKLYGLFSVTKKTYLIVQAFVFLSMIAVFVLLRLYWPADRRGPEWFFQNAELIVGAIFIAEICETLYVLWKFRQAEER